MSEFIESRARSLLARFLVDRESNASDHWRSWLAQQDECRSDSDLMKVAAQIFEEMMRIGGALERGTDEPDGAGFTRYAIPSSPGHSSPGRSSPGIGGDLRSKSQVGDFKLVREVGRGGMGVVWEARQESLGRTVALKLVLPERVDRKSLDLFAREARAGGRLSHPNLVGTIATGVNEGLAWIAQEFVAGSYTLKDRIDALRAADGVEPAHYRWTAETFAAIADGLQAAHDAGVIHRDIKPANILLATGDVPKVTDFGLARVQDDPVLSQTGDFAGTFYYMSPEQVAAKRMGLDHRTDIFSLGVMLYETLALRRPFEGDTTHQIAEKIVVVDPPLVSRFRSQCPSELAVICSKAIDKAPGRRYQSMRELADDLRRHLANEPIVAQPPGRWARLVKWSKRNPAVSAATSVSLLALVVVSLLLVRTLRTSESNARLAVLANERAEEISAQTSLATRRLDDVLSLSASQDLAGLIAGAQKLWPARPQMLPRYEAWLSDARQLLEGRGADPDHDLKARPSLDQHRARLADLRSRAVPVEDPERLARAEELAEGTELAALRGYRSGLETELEAGSAADPEAARIELGQVEAAIAELEIGMGLRVFASPEEAWWHRQLSGLVRGIEALHDPKNGLAGDTLTEEFGWGIARRRDFASNLVEASISSDSVRRRWELAVEGIAASPQYAGMELAPQQGLVPIGADPDSGLWEFAHLQTGTVPRRDRDGRLAITEESALVFVLIPAGTFAMGAQSIDELAPNYDPAARPNEGPLRDVELSAFFISKYEMTQGQWQRIAGINPSGVGAAQYDRRLNRHNLDWSTMHPVEQVSWRDAKRTVDLLGLTLPTEAQWEYACRGGTETVFWPGDEVESLSNAANIADAFAKANGGEHFSAWEASVDDGNALHARVGSYAANGFGLHDTLGNVWEWCLDEYVEGAYGEERSGPDPVVVERGVLERVCRGGSFNSPAAIARSAFRLYVTPDFGAEFIGLRPARPVDPTPQYD
ncbi:bifunctional serine/threonine-protein kinase/formylglycine-generating enzyme family protein [Engelhardtia mirabilis]|uniref:Serine/threonine-protein kinase PrkC n=1 Tax=Engelhardtia mirabilis TaxID=2528011 RepID=A0A518BMM9_9BACT|nr:Serine/threonine-protein kinase PrkC [Planctomycetes bacterium Pla133]QDV02565.1 Serine/threonine-protein kinase PrkC [Planctomycetes bacterium Pla86]